ncbi:hypothetical protein I2W78_10030 [Streptomyces spinoverrucosus]|nr:hypothetical protein [Streptomyces spinoverrucosus]
MGLEHVTGCDGRHRAQRPGEHEVAGAQRLAPLGERRRQQTAALRGLPRQSAPVPSETVRPTRVMVIVTARRSTPVSGTGLPPRTYGPQEALSATVSTREMSQSETRLSTISSAGSAKSTARGTSTTVHSRCGRSRPSTSATSASTRGWSSRPAGTSPPSGTVMSANSAPKSGRSTPSCRCTATEVRPILRPTIRRPASWPRRTFSCCTA